MLITDKKQLKKFYSFCRIWQGIPSVEVTGKGRIFSAFYSGGTKEQVGNFAVLVRSDNGTDFGEPIAVAFKEGYRCYDPCLWIDPLDRLWFVWACAPDHAVYATICENPDADELIWGEVFKIGEDVMMNKPTVISTGEWLFPIAVWHRSVRAGGFESDKIDSERKAFVYKTLDCGKNFARLGGADIDKRSYDEHMIVELLDGRLAMYVRTSYGIGVSYSFDGGKTWTAGENSGLGGPSSRFYIGRLRSGRLLLVNHYNFSGRNNLTAMLSEDDGKTWKYKLLIDGRNNVSYPDVKEAEDGYIYIAYDRERGAFLNSLNAAYSSAREILLTKITEEDIMSGKKVDGGSRIGIVVSKLGKYAFENENPYCEAERFSDVRLVQYLSNFSNAEMIDFIFGQYGVNCMNMHRLDSARLDELIEALDADSKNKEKVINELVMLVRTSSHRMEGPPIIERILKFVEDNLTGEFSVREIADELGISLHYMCHLFKNTTGLTIVEYKNEMKIMKAKRLLSGTDKKITEIAQECGFGSDSYFGKVFMESEKVSPTEYRSFVR